MTEYVDIAQGLVDYGYLNDTDLEAATDLLADALVMDEDKRDEAILEAEAVADTAVADTAVADTAVAADDVAMETIYQVEVHDDVMNTAGDAEILAGGDAFFGVVFASAAAALLDADLIDESNREAVVSLIADFWIDDEE